MRLIFPTILNPTFKNFSLLLRKTLVALRRRHHLVFINMCDAMPNFTPLQIARLNRLNAILQRIGSFLRI